MVAKLRIEGITFVKAVELLLDNPDAKIGIIDSSINLTLNSNKEDFKLDWHEEDGRVKCIKNLNAPLKKIFIELNWWIEIPYNEVKEI